MYKHHLTVWGEDLAKAQALPQNASADGNGPVLDFSGTMGGIEFIGVADTQLALADTKALTIKLQHADPEGSFLDLSEVYKLTAAGATTVPAGTELFRFVPPTTLKRRIKAVLSTTDAAATGSVSIFATYLAR